MNIKGVQNIGNLGTTVSYCGCSFGFILVLVGLATLSEFGWTSVAKGLISTGGIILVGSSGFGCSLMCRAGRLADQDKSTVKKAARAFDEQNHSGL